MNPRLLLASALALPFCVGCYTDLEDESAYLNCQVQILTAPRNPNQPPGNISGVGGVSNVNPEACVTAEPSATPAPVVTPAPVPSEPDPATPQPSGSSPEVPGPTPAEDPFASLPPGCEDVPGTIFGVEGKCGGLGCHGSPSGAGVFGDLGFEVDTLTTRLVNKPGTGACVDSFWVDPANPDASLLITKLSDPPTCGAAMPYVGGEITDAERDCIIAWTRAVAASAN